MSDFGTDLHRFGLDPDSPPDQAQWQNLCRFIRALVNNPSLNIGTENSLIVIPESVVGQAIRPTAREDKPFCFTYKDGSTTKLRGGVVTGGETNHTVADITLTPATSPENHRHWLAITFEANEADDVLLPGVASITTITNASGAAVPDNELPTMAEPTGLYHIVLGRYTGSSFIPLGCGNILLTHCPGSVGYYRAT